MSHGASRRFPSKRRSLIWKLTREEFQSVIDRSNGITSVLENIGLGRKGSNTNAVKLRILEDGIDLTKLKANRIEARKNTTRMLMLPLEQVMVDNSNYSRSALKKRLLDEGILEEKCDSCGLGPEWNGQRLVLQLDHKNGVHDDHRRENLRMLCPNCHSQTANFAGLANKRVRSSVSLVSAGVRKGGGSKISRRKVDRPSREELASMLWKEPTTVVAARYGVSDNAVAKWARSYGIKKPPRGHWSRFGSGSKIAGSSNR